MQDWKYLKSGSDVRGVALDGYKDQAVNLTPDMVETIAGAFALWLADQRACAPGSLKIALGRDCRLSSQTFAVSASIGLRREGVTVYDCGLCTTPAMFTATLPDSLDCDAAIMITASHLPWNRNGMKFITRQGGLSGSDIDEILEDCPGYAPPNKELGVSHRAEHLSRYSAQMTEAMRRRFGEKEPLLGMRIIVDAGNGVGGFFARDVLRPLGADITGSIYLEPDGRFPNHIPNPEDPQAMAAIVQAVADSQADLGIIFDTDCDRAAIVDRHGREINRDSLIALVATIMLEEEPGGTIVTDSVTSNALSEFIAALGGRHRRYRRGYAHVIGEARALDAIAGIETSGHCALRENYYLDDGAYLSLRIVERAARLNRAGKDITSLLAGLRLPKEECELRFAIQAGNFQSYAVQVLHGLSQAVTAHRGWYEEDSAEGIRVNCGVGFGDGWFLLRPSVHDPVMVLNMQSDVPGGLAAMAKTLYHMLEEVELLDISTLKPYICAQEENKDG